jgi:hypothetical protein
MSIENVYGKTADCYFYCGPPGVSLPRLTCDVVAYLKQAFHLRFVCLDGSVWVRNLVSDIKGGI